MATKTLELKFVDPLKTTRVKDGSTVKDEVFLGDLIFPTFTGTYTKTTCKDVLGNTWTVNATDFVKPTLKNVVISKNVAKHSDDIPNCFTFTLTYS